MSRSTFAPSARTRPRGAGLRAGLCLFVTLAFALGTGVATATVEHAAVANRARGATGVLDAGLADRVNLFNGNLTYAVDLGASYPVGAGFGYRLALHYNSLIWDFVVGVQATAAYPAADANAGVGWDLSLGRLHGPAEAGNPTGRWVLVAPDGGQHRFYPTLHPEDPVVPGVFFSRDGTYLRLSDSGGGKVVRYPNGRSLEFGPHLGAWRLTRMEDRHGVGVGIAYAADGNEWTLTDDTGRQHFVRFAPDPTGTYPRLLASVELAAFKGETAIYTFTYTSATLSRPAADEAPTTPATVTVPLLSQVLLPDGTHYAMAYHSSPQDFGGGSDEIGGLLRSLTLPTLGRTEWSYTSRKFPWLDCTAGANRHLADGTAVAGRTLIDRAGAVVGAWTFDAEFDVERPKDSTCDQPRELAVTVTTPLGHQHRQYFSVFVSGDPAAQGGEPWRVEDYGLPLTKHAQDGSGLLLSRQVLEGGTPLESVRVAFDQDAAVACSPPCAERNSRLRASRSVYHDDGGRQVETVRSGYDGFGHFAATVRASSFEGELPRTVLTTYVNDPAGWLLGLPVETRVQRGSEVRATKRCLDGDGQVLRERRLAAATEGPHDLLTRVLRDGGGNAVALEYFGGDVEELATSSDLCSLPLGAPQYRQELAYEAGVVHAARWVGPGGETVLATIDRTIDPSTGLIAASRDAAGLATAHGYDLLGRLTEVVRPQQYGSTTVYTNASPTAPARETTTHRSADGQQVLATDRLEIDSFGRRAAEETLDEAGVWVGERTAHNALGNPTVVTDPLGRTTEYLDVDPFGRARRVLPPGGASAEVVHEFAGVRTQRTTRSQGHYLRESDDALIQVARSSLQVFDSDGRLVRSEAPDGAIRRTTYDLGGNLARTTTHTAVDPETTLTVRRFDGRGFLIEETDADDETVVFTGYDALGRLTREVGAHGTVLREFDRAGRLVRVSAEDGPTMKEFTYATANGSGEWGAGKLRQAVRFNHDVPGLSGPLRVVEDYTYAGLGGRLSARRTTLRDDLGVRLVFDAAASYDELGQLATVGYPECDRSWHLVCVEKARTVSYTYHYFNRRLLRTVSSQHNADPPVAFATNVFYFPDGSLERIVFSTTPHAYQTYTAHPDHSGRYLEMSICTTGFCDHFQPMVYDRAGQLAHYRVGPVLPDELRLLPTGYPEPPTARAPLADLRATLADAAGSPGCPTHQRDALGLVTRSDECPGGGVSPVAHFYVYNAAERLLWRAASLNGTSLANWGHRWHLFDLAGRAAREYDQVHPSLNWIRDSIWRGNSLLGWIEGYNAAETAGQRHFVHVDPFGAPVSKHRVENGSVTGWSRW